MLGIDLGDEYSLIAACAGDAEPQVLSDRSGAWLIPQTVALNEWGNSGMPDERATGLFERLRQIAVEQIGELTGPVVVAVPAYFHDGQRTAVVQAARSAGLNVFRLINKPTAAALAYCYEDPANRTMILVLDLRTRGFDATVLKIEGLGCEVLSADRVSELEASLAHDPDRLWAAISPVIGRAMKDARVRPDQLDDILLTGETIVLGHLDGYLQDAFGHPGNTHVNPDQAMALGAAIYAKAFGTRAAAPPAATSPENATPTAGCAGVVLVFLVGILVVCVM